MGYKKDETVITIEEQLTPQNPTDKAGKLHLPSTMRLPLYLTASIIVAIGGFIFG
jgi:hypothetical protein